MATLDTLPVLQTIQTLNRMQLLQPGVTIWRPVFNGAPGDCIPERSKTGNYGVLRTLLPSERNGICEPSINAGRFSRGIVTFLTDGNGNPLFILPDTWIGLTVIRGVSANNPSVYAVPFTGDIEAYLAFRRDVAPVCTTLAAMNCRYAPAPKLARVFCRHSATHAEKLEFEFFN